MRRVHEKLWRKGMKVQAISGGEVEKFGWGINYVIHICHLLLCKTLSQHLVAYNNKHLRSHIVSMSQKFWSSFAGWCRSVSLPIKTHFSEELITTCEFIPKAAYSHASSLRAGRSLQFLAYVNSL